MKKYLLLILLLLMPTGAWGTTWYACASTKNIDSGADSEGTTTSDVWYSEEACTGGSWYTFTTASGFDSGLSAGDILEANAQTALAINVNPGATGKKVHLKTLSGGGFTYATAANLTINADITAGTTTCLTISGSTNGGSIVGDVLGGTSVNATGAGSSHTIVTVSIIGNCTSQTSTSGTACAHSGGSGSLNVSGTAKGGNHASTSGGYGFSCTNASASASVGSCQGSDENYAVGCYGGCPITVTGNLVNGPTSTFGVGKIRWTPTAPSDGVTGNYVKFDGGGTAVFAGKNTDDATKALTTFYYIDPTDGTSDVGSASATSGGGASAW